MRPRIVVARRGANGMVSVRLRFPVDHRTPEANLLLGALVLSRAGQSSSALRAFGAEAAARVDLDHLTVSLTTPAATLDGALGCVAASLGALTVPAATVRSEAARQAVLLGIARTDPSVLADEAANELIYGHQHPYGHPPDVDILSALTADAVAAALRHATAPGRTPGRTPALAIAVGDHDEDRMSDALARTLETPAQIPPMEPAPPLDRPRPFPSASAHVDAPNRAGAHVQVVFPAPPPGDPDLPAFDVAVALLGGSSSSVLFRRLREELGATYGASARVVHAARASALVVSSACARSDAARMLHELCTLSATLPDHVDDALVTDAITRLVTSRRIASSTPNGFADRLLADPSEGEPGARLARERQLRTLTRADVGRIASRYFGGDRRVTVTVD